MEACHLLCPYHCPCPSSSVPDCPILYYPVWDCQKSLTGTWDIGSATFHPSERRYMHHDMYPYYSSAALGPAYMEWSRGIRGQGSTELRNWLLEHGNQEMGVGWVRSIAGRSVKGDMKRVILSTSSGPRWLAPCRAQDGAVLHVSLIPLNTLDRQRILNLGPALCPFTTYLLLPSFL